MRPVDFQPAVVQASNVERIQQQQQAQPQVAQQVAAAQMDRQAAVQLHQVSQASPGQAPDPARNLAEDRGERARRRTRRRMPAVRTAESQESPPEAPAPGGPTIDRIV